MWLELAIVFTYSLICSRILVWALPKLRLVDLPDARRNHTGKIARGGGIAVVTAILLANNVIWTKWSYNPIVISTVIILFVISLLDDIMDLPAIIRLLVQLLVSWIVVDKVLFIDVSWLPLLISPFIIKILLSLMLAWFINAFNFIDGIDGMNAVQTIHIAAVSAYFAWHNNEVIYAQSLIIIAAMLGFLVWNWHPARIFLGDSGSIPLGFIMGYMLFKLMMQGHYAAAAIAPIYTIADTGITITKRLLAGKKIWHAHSEHYYQQAVRLGQSHSKVVIKAILFNLSLWPAIILSPSYPIPTMLMSSIMVLAFLYHLHDKSKGGFMMKMPKL
jgi:UDP-N-acetylmuramyl pentapeptide phosphotransferase/UDP-N-acetylglucosamine-1-phosphate transferase